MLMERALLDLNLAFAAGEPSGTDAFDFHPKLARGFQQGFPLLDPAPAAGGHEDDLGGGHGQFSVFSVQ
jgi:hypothetical protein